jgi:plastocyanin
MRPRVGYGPGVLRAAVAVIALSAAPMLLASCSSDRASEAGAGGESSRTIDITATDDYTFNGDPGTIVAGDTIEFAVENIGQLDHSLEVLSSAGRSLGKTERIPAGSTDSVTVTFETAGDFRLICDIDDHLSRGQSATVTVG